MYVVANIRGGGEFGPTWHQAALREHRHRAYEDFIAVAEDIIARRITSSDCLAIRGGSNGGLLVGNAMTLRPDLFAAVCCAVPLLDMKTYHTLLAGASWMAEYGNPDVVDDWAFLQKYSAYHQIDPAVILRKQYPALLMTTSTRDDRVHPYHARCFVKRLIDPDNKYQPPVEGSTANSNQLPGPVSRNLKIRRGEVLYYENIEGGHGGAADNKQQAFMNVRPYFYCYLLSRHLILTYLFIVEIDLLYRRYISNSCDALSSQIKIHCRGIIKRLRPLSLMYTAVMNKNCIAVNLNMIS